MTAEQIALKPCPFCGSSNVHLEGHNRQIGRFVECGNCDATGPEMYARQAAIAAWNTRAQETPDAQ